jgi:heme-degrading monooxygenase HmoA
MTSRHLSHFTVLSLGITLGVALQAHKPLFTPKVGGIVVVYSHHFQKDKWAEARKVFQNRFYKEIKKDDKDIRDSYILENPERAEILGITLWRSAKDLEDWEKQPERAIHQRELDPFRSKPFEAKRYRMMDEVIE